jgi:outer membrane protein, multidrug efflux system
MLTYKLQFWFFDRVKSKGQQRGVVTSALVLALAGCAVAPNHLTREELLSGAVDARSTMFEGQDPITAPLTLDAALGRAMLYNLDGRVAALEEATQRSQLRAVQYNMLPQLTLNAGYFQRDRDLISSNFSIDTSTVSGGSISQDRTRGTGDLTLSWNVVDFGTGYYLSRQQADQVLVAAERRRRATNNMFQEVSAAYWQAAAAQRLLPRVRSTLADARGALAQYRELEQTRAVPLEEALRNQSELLALIDQLEAVAEDMRTSEVRLAQLMGLPPNSTFRLSAPSGYINRTPRLTHSTENLEIIALVNRPEVREEAYNIRLAQTEARQALLRFIPAFNPFIQLNRDSNSYLFYQNWAELGLRVTSELIGLASRPAVAQFGEQRVELAEARRLAVSMAVVSQVNLAVLEFERNQRLLVQSRARNEVDQRLYRLVVERAGADAANELELVRAATAALASELRLSRSHANLMNVHAAVFVALGLDPVPTDLPTDDLPAVMQGIRQVQDAWWNNRVELPALPEPEQVAVVIVEQE